MDEPGVAGTVLIVEDEPLIRRFIGGVLAEAGYGTLEAGNAKEAAHVAKTHAGPLSLVISDIRMPGGSGLDFANDLASSRPGTPVLYISGLVDSIVVESIAKQDPQAILTKPFTANQLLDRIRVMLGSVAQGRGAH